MPDADFDVRYIAKLARLQLSEEEELLFQGQLASVLAYANKLQEVDISDVESSAHGSPIFNVFREDEERDWFTPEEALSNAPRQANDLFVVPKVLE